MNANIQMYIHGLTHSSCKGMTYRECIQERSVNEYKGMQEARTNCSIQFEIIHKAFAVSSIVLVTVGVPAAQVVSVDL